MRTVLTTIAVSVTILAITPGRPLADTSISKGDTPEEVQKAAGDPMGKMTQGGKVVWLYRRGNVIFVDGKVAEVSWMTEAQFAEHTRRKQEGARAAAEAREQAEAAKKAAPPVKTGPILKGSLPPPRAPARRPAPFARKPSDSAKFIGAIPVEFERILMPKQLVESMNVQIGRLTGEKRRKAFSGLQAAIARYPKELTENTVNTVYFPSQILSGGDSVGGFADISSRNIYITSSRGFHHEFAHVLLATNFRLFPKDKWLALNEKDYTSDGRLVRVVYEARQRYGSPYYHDNGFINRYAMVSKDEDFAETFEIAFEHPDIMTRIANGSERISKKLDIIVQFLNDIVTQVSGKHSAMTRADILGSR